MAYNDSTEAYEDQQEQIDTLMNALRAIRARIDGEWDNPALLTVGGLSADTLHDIHYIANKAIEETA